MGLSDELEALRQAGRVKSQSNLLSDQVTKHGFTSPEAEAEKLKLKSQQEKQSRLDAQANLRHGASGNLSDLNLLYKKLMTEQRLKKREAEKNLHLWRKQYGGKDGNKEGGEEDGEDDVPPMPISPTSAVAEEVANKEALEMLPEHVVTALKARYDTEDGAAALAQALKEESEHGKGALAELMEIPEAEDFEDVASPVKAPYNEEKAAEEKKEPEEETSKEEVLPAVEEEEEEQPKAEPVEEPKEEHSEPVQEVTEKIEQLTIEDDVKKEEEAPKEEEVVTKPPPPDVDRILQTKRFYDTHTQEYIDNISSPTNNETDNDSAPTASAVLTPTAHRDAFLAHIHLNQNLNSNDATTILDLGCGYGRDTQYFSTECNQHVLGVDYSRNMLLHAKTLAPRAHYLNVDFRDIRNIMMEQSVDGIWANACMFHLPKVDIENVMRGLYEIVKEGGVLYLSLKIGSDGEVFDIDERYTAIAGTAEASTEDASVVDSRYKLYSYFTMDEVKELLSSTGWNVMEIGENDKREQCDYVKHSYAYVFATRRNK